MCFFSILSIYRGFQFFRVLAGRGGGASVKFGDLFGVVIAAVVDGRWGGVGQIDYVLSYCPIYGVVALCL